MIIKTTASVWLPLGYIVSGTSFRVIQVADGYHIIQGDHKGVYVPAASAMVIEDVEQQEDGRKRRRAL